MKKLVPYGKFLKNLLSNGQIPVNDVYLFIGLNAWEKARNFQLSRPGTLCLPPGTLPYSFDWPVMGCDILIFDTSFANLDSVETLAKHLFMHDANIIRYCSLDGELIVYKKDF